MTSKNKASTQMHIQCQQAKKQASKQTNNCARRMSQHAEKCRNIIAKKMHHSFDDCNVNKTSIDTGQKHKSNKKQLSKGKTNIRANNAQTITQFAHVTPKQTWPTGSCTQKQN